MRSILALLTVTMLTANAAWADRPVTVAERAKLVALLAAEGCSGGEMEFDDGKYEVGDARCADGRLWGFEFDREFRLIKKKRDD